MSTAVVFQQMLIIFMLIGIGFLIFKKGWCPHESSKYFSFLVTSVCNPAIMISSALDKETTATRGDILVTAGIAFIVFTILIIAGYVLPVLLRAPKNEHKFYNMMTVYGNISFIGIPVVSAVLGTSAVIYVTVFNLFFNVLIYTHGILVLNPETNNEKEPLWKKLINVGTIAAVITIIIFWFKVPLPEVVASTIGHAGKCTTFLSMVVLGSSLVQIKFKDIFTVPRLYIFFAIRMIAFTVILGLILKMFFTNTMMINAILLMMSMPCANMPLMLAKQYDMDCPILSKGILLSTMLSLITITMVSFIGTL